MKQRTMITEGTVRKLIRDLLEGQDVFEPDVEAVNVDSQIGSLSFDEEDEASLSNVVRSSPDDTSKNVRDVDKTTRERKTKKETAMKKSQKKNLESVVEALLRKKIRKMLSEAPIQYHGVDYFGDSSEDDDEPKKTKRAYKSTAIGGMADVEGASFSEIAKELGLSVAGAKRTVDQVLKKVRFIASEYQEADDLEIVVLHAIKDYIDKLSSTGELSSADVELLQAHPGIVRELDGFREFLEPYVKQHYKMYGEED